MTFRTLGIVLTVALIGSIALAGDDTLSEQPKSPAAVAALQKYEIAAGKVQLEYERVVDAARRQAISS